MAKRSKPVDDGPTPPRRGGEPGGRRELPDNMQRLAAGDDYAMRTPRARRENVRDQRDRVLIPGVNNKDSRRVYDERVTALRTALELDGMDERIGQGLLVVQQLRLYRARNVVDFAAFATSVLGMELERAEALLGRAREAASAGEEALPEPLIALFIRTESALREHLGDVQVVLEDQGGTPRLGFSVPAAPAQAAVDALSAVGRQAAGLAHMLGKSGGPERPQPRMEESGEEGAEESAGDAQDPRATVADRPLMRRPQRDDDPREGSRGGFERGPRRDDNQRGGFGRGPRRDDDQRGGFNRGPRRDDDQRGGFDRGPRRDDDQRGGGPRGGFDRGPRRDDDQRGGGPRGGFNRGPRRDDDQRGGFNRGPRRDDDQRGGFNRGPRREGDQRGSFNKKKQRDED